MSDIRVGFFSLTSGAVSGDDAAYLRWHLLDHLPEQYSIVGIRLGTRWRADEECVRLRVASTPDLDPVRHAVGYFISEPVEATLAAFARLGRQLAEQGRYPEPATPHLLGAFERREAHAAPGARVSAGVVPFRAHRGIYLIVERPRADADLEAWGRWHAEEHVPGVLAVRGVAGVWTFASSDRLGHGSDQGERFGTSRWDPGGSLVTVVYLDDEVDATAARLAPLVRARWDDGVVTPRLSGPFRSPVAYEAWPHPP